MPAKSDPRARLEDSDYFYRRELSVVGLVPAVGVGIAVGVAAYYLTRLYLERTPLVSKQRRRTAASGPVAMFSRARDG